MEKISVMDVAKYFIYKSVPQTEKAITHLKLQKLVYYAQAFHLAMDKGILFENELQAWIHGPVCYDLYRKYNKHGASEIYFDGNEEFLSRLEPQKREFLDAIWTAYGHLGGAQLERLTHRENPWIEARARARVDAWEASDEPITQQSMKTYYKTFFS